MKDDLDKYISRRKRTDKKFAKNFNSGCQEFKVGVSRTRPVTLDELEAKLLQSVERLDRGEGVDGVAVFRRLRKRIKEARGNS